MQYGFITHPDDVPVRLARLEAEAGTGFDMQHRRIQGGVVIHTRARVRPGDLVEVHTGLRNRPVSYRARVLWVIDRERPAVGLVFENEQQAFIARMTEQVCHIEQYRRNQAAQGRLLTESEAAHEWIEQFSHDFPRIGPIVPTEHIRHSAA